MLESLPNLLTKAKTLAEDIDDEFNPNLRLRQVLSDADITNQYDTLVIDPSPKAGPGLYNAVAATGSLVLPIEATGKGMEAIAGLEDIVNNLGDALNLEVGVLAVVPNAVGRTREQDEYVERIRQLGYNVPVVIRERSSLFDGCWNEQCTAFQYVGYHRDRRREYEIETLDKLRDLADSIEEVGGR
jgi:chromosome partitioning protein